MKKRFLLILILFISMFFVLGCKDLKTLKTEKTLLGIFYQNNINDLKKEGYQLIGILHYQEVEDFTNLPSGKYYKLYIYDDLLDSVTIIEEGEYLPVFVEDGKYQMGSYSFPSIKIKGLIFSGIYNSEGIRISAHTDEDIVYVRYLSYFDTIIISILCILIVFMVLAILSLIIKSFKLMKKNHPQNEEIQDLSNKKEIKLEDIKDEDMLAATLVASIDYHEEVKKDVKVVSVKEVK